MNADKLTPPPLIGLVGPCASGKSTLSARLIERGYRVRHIAQEHSYVQDMWKRLSNPDILIFLDASYPVTVQRRQLDWNEADWAEQQRRLLHARAHADLYILTDGMTVDGVTEKILRFIEQIQGG